MDSGFGADAFGKASTTASSTKSFPFLLLVASDSDILRSNELAVWFRSKQKENLE